MTIKDLQTAIIKTEDPTCENCKHREGPVCYECAGENHGLATEVTVGGFCLNWKPWGS